MIIVWRGRGYLVLVTGLSGLVLTESCVRLLSHDENYYSTHWWTLSLGGAVAGALTFLLAKLLNHRRTRYAVDEKTGERIDLTPRDSLFAIPVRFWPWILFALGILIGVVAREPG